MSKQISLYVQLDVDLGDHYKLLRLTNKLNEDVRVTSQDVRVTSEGQSQECPCVVHGCHGPVITEEQVIGFLYRMWSWVLRFSSDKGSIEALGDDELAMIMRYPGTPEILSKALVEVGFVSDSAIINGWDEIYGALVRKRKEDRDRKRKSRGSHTDVTRTSADVTRMSSVEKSREEKTREDHLSPLPEAMI